VHAPTIDRKEDQMSSQTPRTTEPEAAGHWTRMRSRSASEILGVLERRENEPKAVLDMAPWKLVAPRTVTAEAG